MAANTIAQRDVIEKLAYWGILCSCCVDFVVDVVWVGLIRSGLVEHFQKRCTPNSAFSVTYQSST